MPYALAVRPAHQLGMVRLVGEVTGKEIATAASELAARPDWEDHFRVIWDTTDQTGLDMEYDAFEGIVAQERDLLVAGESGELVFVIDDEIWASLVTLFKRKMRDQGRPATVVRTRTAALAHLGIDPE